MSFVWHLCEVAVALNGTYHPDALQEQKGDFGALDDSSRTMLSHDRLGFDDLQIASLSIVSGRQRLIIRRGFAVASVAGFCVTVHGFL